MKSRAYDRFAHGLVILGALMLMVTMAYTPSDSGETSGEMVVVEEESAHNTQPDCRQKNSRTLFWNVQFISRSTHNGVFYLLHYHHPRPLNILGKFHTQVSKCTGQQLWDARQL